MRLGQFLLIVGLMGGWAVATPAVADPLVDPMRVAIVDMQRILQESTVAKTLQKQLDSQRAKYQKETEGEENSLRQAEQSLQKEQKKLSADVYGQREQQLRERFLTVERRVNTRRKALDQAYTTTMNTVRSTVQDIVAAIAQERGVNLVLAKQQILWTAVHIDITDDVLRDLNKKMPRATVEIPDDVN